MTGEDTMFLAHFGVGFGAKRVAPQASLATLFLAAQFIDLIWPTFLLLRIEQVLIRPGTTRVTPLDFVSYPLSHSLLLVLGWGVLFGGVYRLLRRYRVGAYVTAACVISHWFLDLLVHRPDLPLTPIGVVKVGLGAWSSLPATLVLESLFFTAGVVLYARATVASDRLGRYGLWGLVAFLAITYVGSLFGPPPPSVKAIAWVGQAQWLIVLFAWILDRHRSGRVGAAAGSEPSGRLKAV